MSAQNTHGRDAVLGVQMSMPKACGRVLVALLHGRQDAGKAAPHLIPGDFFGINVAPPVSAEQEAYVIERLRELEEPGVRVSVRMNRHEEAVSFIDTLLEQGFGVLPVLVAEPDTARVLSRDDSARERWASFVRELFERWGDRVDGYEIGSVSNRRKWSGWSYRSYLAAWALACREADGRAVTLLGPNVSDFEPIYNAIYLSWMKRLGRCPAVQTDNLFVERCRQPEVYDHRVAGHRLGRILKLDLVQKARILRRIGKACGVSRLFCTYIAWSDFRLKRWSSQYRQKRADYLVRYLVLAAAGGDFERVYWGPLLGHRDGLIDDGSDQYPSEERVFCYGPVEADPKEYSVEPAFHALGYVIRRLAGSECLGGESNVAGWSVFDFRDAQGVRFSVVWARDEQVWPLSAFFSDEDLNGAVLTDGQGQPRMGCATVSEVPLFIEFSTQVNPPIRVPAAGTVRFALGCRCPIEPGVEYVPFDNGTWRGVVRVTGDAAAEEVARLYLPEQLEKLSEIDVLRDKRNRVWMVTDPASDGALVVKRIRVLGMKKLTYRWRFSKGRRNWNAASAMIRMGIRTPRPIAFFERCRDGSVNESYYCCEPIMDAWSARDAFNSFRRGASECHGLGQDETFDLLAAFLAKMHSCGIIHRDSSAGNLLLRFTEDGTPEVLAIDIGRACIRDRRLSERERTLDLIRLCHPLDWPLREDFLSRYYARWYVQLTGWRRLPFMYYDFKHWFKRVIRPLRPSKR